MAVEENIKPDEVTADNMQEVEAPEVEVEADPDAMPMDQGAEMTEEQSEAIEFFQNLA